MAWMGVVAALGSPVALSGCSSSTDAEVASRNLSLDADQFKINRRIIFYNGITDKYMLTLEGRCSINHQGEQLEVTCKVSSNGYKKHFLGLSDNVTYFVEQLDEAPTDVYHYKVLFKPETIVPTIDIDTSGNAAKKG